MKDSKEDPAGQDRRRYIRLDSVFPVEFHILSSEDERVLSEELQGFTNNVGEGGICLTVNNLDPALVEILKNKQAKVSLCIEMPLSGKPTFATGRVAWVQEVSGYPRRYIIGLSYEEIAPSANRLIMRYAFTKKMIIPVILSILFILGLGFAAGTYLNIKLIRGNKALVDQLVIIIQESSVAKQKIKELNKDKEDIQVKIHALQLQIQNLEEERARISQRPKQQEAGSAKKKEGLGALIEKLTQDKTLLQERLIALQNKENAISEELLRLDVRKVILERVNLEKMHKWLKLRQNPRTGLVVSSDDGGDVNGWAFVYDQSLAMQVYLNFADFERARKVFDFFEHRGRKTEAGFFNAYYAKGGAPAEQVISSGPNIWLGIAIMQYTHKTKDKRYLGLAEEIASRIISLQNQDKEGGIRGGPVVAWYIREHNLDAYAFFNMLYKLTEKTEYLAARDKVLSWIVANYSNNPGGAIKRGRGDSTIVTDTYAWSIAAIGPEKLEELGMNPDMIMDSVEKACAVESNFARPQGRTVKIKGFDFAASKNSVKTGVISSEWTAQMAIAFRIMSDFYYKKNMVAKGRSYALKADEYLMQLGNMVISSPSPSGQGESCLPYATEEVADTGHGWVTSKGKSTGSVAGTAYTLFAYYNYNPLELKE